MQPLNSLSSPEQEERMIEILARLRTEVKHRGLILSTFFDDFDKVRLAIHYLKCLSMCQQTHTCVPQLTCTASSLANNFIGNVHAINDCVKLLAGYLES